MSPLAGLIRSTRCSMARMPPDNMSKFDLLSLNASLFEILTCLEKHITLTERKTETMNTKNQTAICENAGTVRAMLRGQTLETLIEGPDTGQVSGYNSATGTPGDGVQFSAAAREAIKKILAAAMIDDAEKLRRIKSLLGA